MTFVTLNLVFPIILAVHNLDEYSRYDEFVHASPVRLPDYLTERRVVRNAAILLTLAVAVLAVLTDISGSTVLITFSRVAIFSLLLNGISHCVASVKRRTVTPGTLSAVFLVLPYCAVAIFNMRTSSVSMLGDAAIGALITPVAIVICLWLGYATARLAEPAREVL